MATHQNTRIKKVLALQATVRRRKLKLHRVGPGRRQHYLWKPSEVKRFKTYTYKANASGGRVCKTCLGLQMGNKAQVIAALKAGLPVGSFNRLQKALAIRMQELAGIVQIPVRTLVRRQREKHFDVDESERVLRIGLL